MNFKELRGKLEGLLKKKPRKIGENGKSASPVKVKPTCVKIFPDCACDGDRAFRPKKERCFSLVDRDFGIKISDKPQGYAVRDEATGKWISWTPRKGRDIPLFPFLLEFAKRQVKERKNVATVFLLDTPCGFVRLKISPSIPEVREKIVLTATRKNRKEAELMAKAFQPREIIDTFGRSPFLVIVNSEKVRDFLLSEIDRTPRPPEIKEKLRKTALENLMVVDRPFLFAVASVKGSPEIKVPKEVPAKAVLALLLAGIVAFGGVNLYLKKKKEEEARRLALQRQLHQKWTPSPVFKKNHLAYLFFPTSEDFKRLTTALYPPEGFRLLSASMSLTSLRLTYQTPYLVEGGKRKGELFLLEKNLRRTPKPSWESVRGRKPLTIPPMKEVIRRYANSVVEVGRETIDGVPVLAARVVVQKTLSPKELKEELLKASTTPMEVESLAFKLRKDGLYTYSLRGKIFGLEEKNER